MATLRNPHWEAVPPLVRDLLADIGQEPFSRRFYMAGGTALALRLGHRISVDLDFFSEADDLWDESRAEIVAALRRRRAVDVLEDVTGNLLLRIAEAKIDAQGNLMTESFANSHFHLCKVYTLQMIDEEALRDDHGADMGKAMTVIELTARVKEKYDEA